MESDNLPQAATPTSTTAAEFETSASVTLTCSTAGASLYYTLDGSTPTVNSTLYTGPITITKTTTVKALAAKSGYARSDVFTRTFVSAAAIDEYYFRHDFSNGTRVFTAGEGSGLTRDQTNSTDSNAKAVEGPDGPGTAHHPGNVWGQFEQPTVLHGAWSAAMSLCMDATETGILVSFGRLNKADQKEVALLSSSTKSNFYFKVMTTDSSKAKSVENTFTVVTTNDLTVGFHSFVVAYTPASEVHNGAGSFDIYCDGVRVRTVSTDTPKLLGADVGGMQYCMLMSGGSDLAALGTVSSQANDAVADALSPRRRVCSRRRRRGAWCVRHGPWSLHVRGQHGRKRAGLLHGSLLLYDDRRVRRGGGRISPCARLQAVREGRKHDVLRQYLANDVQAIPRDSRRRKCWQGRLDHCGEVNSLDRITHENFQLPLAKVRTFGIISSNNVREK